MATAFYLAAPEASLLLVDWSLEVVLHLASDSLAETQLGQRVFRRVLARKVFEEEVEVPEFEGLMLSFWEQLLLGEPQMGPRLLCRFCCQSWPYLVWDPGLEVYWESPVWGSLTQP